ncbi:MAG: uroporphyrinogen decarboxylase/cobalamine-independent methonine synthase family protein [Planctomycetota bacterium]|jgi:hypothetical protein
MISITGTLSKAWMAKALGVRFDHNYYFNPGKRHAIDCKCNEYAAEHFPGMRLFYSESNLGQIDYWDRTQIQIGGIQPTMILGLLLGADFVPQDDKDADITPQCLADVDVEDLPEPETLLNKPLIRLFDEQLHHVKTSFEGQMHAIAPFFWDMSGRATIHGVLTSAQKLIGEAFFIDLINRPELCLEIMHWIAEVYIVLCQHFSEAVKLPISEVHVGECSSCIVGPELIERFVVPTTSKIGQRLGPIRLHSCGPSTSHLKAFSKIANLQSLDLGGDSSIREARDLFGTKMLISVAPLPKHMSEQSSDYILVWAKRILEENDGGDLEYVYHLEPSYNINTIYALTEFVSHLSNTQDT